MMNQERIRAQMDEPVRDTPEGKGVAAQGVMDVLEVIRIGALKDATDLESFYRLFEDAMGYGPVKGFKTPEDEISEETVIYIKAVHDPTRPMGFLRGWNSALKRGS